MKINKFKKKLFKNDYKTHLKKLEIKIYHGGKKIENSDSEIFKNVNYSQPNFMKNTIMSKSNASARPNDILVKKHNSVTYADKSLLLIGPKIYTKLRPNINSETSINKEYIEV